jgi:hypothetical protein
MNKKLIRAAQKYARKKYKPSVKKHLFAVNLSNHTADKQRYDNQVFDDRYVDGFLFEDTPHTAPGKMVFMVVVETKVTVKPHRFISDGVEVLTKPLTSKQQENFTPSEQLTTDTRIILLPNRTVHR